MEVEAFVQGRPCTNRPSRSKKAGELQWQSRVERGTAQLNPISGACELEVDFYLERGNPSPGQPHGHDLDNLLNPVMDGLKNTVLRNNPEGDGAIVSIIARKHIAPPGEPIGVKISLREIGN